MGEMTVDEAWEAAGLPSPDSWAGISDDERRYREGVLLDIARRVAEEGLDVPIPGDYRGKQFMPFAALKGYGDVISDAEDASAVAAKPALDTVEVMPFAHCCNGAAMRACNGIR